MRHDRRRLSALALKVLLLATAGVGLTASGFPPTPIDAFEPGAIRPHLQGDPTVLATPEGTPSALSAQWWMWALETEFSQFAGGGVDCRAGQRGRVWFLAGTLGGDEDRACAVARGRALFFPLINAVWFNLAGDDPQFLLSVDEKRELLDAIMRGARSQLAELVFGVDRLHACHLHASLDGRPLAYETPMVRVQSPEFLHEGDPNAISDGFWVLLPPPERGHHLLEYGGALCTEEGTEIFGSSVALQLLVR